MKKLFIFFVLYACYFPVEAQFSIDGQILQRAEYRHGFGSLIEQSSDPAMFIGQRARIGAHYKSDKVNFHVSIQDIRIWGNAPQVKATDPFLSVHEAYAETFIHENWSLKLGRQELNYDNFRFLGNLDWALQARAHDFALAKYEKNQMKLHFGAGYNQDGERLSGNIFTTQNQYKAAQLIRYENAFENFNFTLLFWNDGRQFVERNNLNEIVNQGIRYRQTYGIPAMKYQWGNTTLSSFYYHQLGRDVNGRNINGFDISAQASQLFPVDNESGKKFRLTLGFEIISGNSTIETSGRNSSFSPLYGTNHLFQGYMDHFFVGGRFENSVGISDFFVRTRYDFNPKVFISFNAHNFSSYADVYRGNEKLSRDLGAEFDLSLGWLINDILSLQSGYSQLLASETYEFLQGFQNYDSRQNWAYVMMIYRPNMKNRFIGMLF
ncbi:MAG: hypothetical protein JJU28_03895 [Cyclobacteriaceae bacterium]|nr:hypothetical protein [Cyclobacteriaceae bacterium]